MACARNCCARNSTAAGLPARIVRIPYPCPNEIYEREMAAAIAEAKADGVTHMIFGDLFLQDIRDYRERQLAGSGITPVFPLWLQADRGAGARHDRRRHRGASDRGRSEEIAGSISPAGASTPTCSPRLPAGVDPCGENGEFHTFVSAGPMLTRKIAVRVGETVERDGFALPDLLPRAAETKPAARRRCACRLRRRSCWPSASISASVMVLSRGCMVTAMAIDFLPASMPLPS